MEAIFELVFGNLLVVIALIGGLISLFQRASTSKSEKTSRPRDFQPNPTPTPSGGGEGEKAEETKTVEEQHQPSLKDGAQHNYEQKQEMINDLNANLEQAESVQRKSNNAHSGMEDTGSPRVSRNKEHRKNEPRLSVNGYLNRKRIAESVIMTEVLGSPRSQKPYRPFITRRKK